MTWIEARSGLFNIATPNVTPDSSAAGSGVVMKVYVDDTDKAFLSREGDQCEISQRGRDLVADR